MPVTSGTTSLCDWSSASKLASESGSELPHILDDEFSISTYLSVDSDLTSERIYFNNDASSVSTDFSDGIEAENRYFDDISDSKQQIPVKYKTKENQRKIIPSCIGQIAMHVKGKKGWYDKIKIKLFKTLLSTGATGNLISKHIVTKYNKIKKIMSHALLPMVITKLPRLQIPSSLCQNFSVEILWI